MSSIINSHHILADHKITSTSTACFTLLAPGEDNMSEHPDRLCWIYIHIDGIEVAKMYFRMSIDKDSKSISLDIFDVARLELEDTDWLEQGCFTDPTSVVDMGPISHISIPCFELAQMCEPFRGLAIDALTEAFMKVLDGLGRVFILNPKTKKSVVVDAQKFNDSDTTYLPGCVIVTKSQIKEMLRIAVGKLVVNEFLSR